MFYTYQYKSLFENNSRGSNQTAHYCAVWSLPLLVVYVYILQSPKTSMMFMKLQQIWLSPNRFDIILGFHSFSFHRARLFYWSRVSYSRLPYNFNTIPHLGNNVIYHCLVLRGKCLWFQFRRRKFIMQEN